MATRFPISTLIKEIEATLNRKDDWHMVYEDKEIDWISNKYIEE